MSVDAFQWALTQQVTGGSKSVLLVLAWRMNRATGLCCPSVDQIADDCGLTRRTVQRHLTQLCDSGVIEIEKRFGGVLGRRSNDYNFPAYTPIGQNVTLVEQTKGTKATDQRDAMTDQCDAVTDQPDTATPIKKGKGKKRKQRAGASRRAPKNFSIDDDMKDWLRKEGVDLQFAQIELEKFRDHEFPRPYSDWPATFRNWIRRVMEWQPTKIDVPARSATTDLALKLGLTRLADESDQQWEKRLSDRSVAEQYGYPGGQRQH